MNATERAVWAAATPEECSLRFGTMLDTQTLRDLSKAAKNVQTWTEKRNELIKSAHAAGGGVREISRTTGLNVATVHNILKPRKR